LTSRVAMPAILDTTVSAIVVLPVELTNAESPRPATSLLDESLLEDCVLDAVEDCGLVIRTTSFSSG